MLTNKGAPCSQLSERLQKAVGEMYRCFKAKAFTATAIAGRRSIEILCAERGITKKMATQECGFTFSPFFRIHSPPLTGR
jgi:hypothetical protein